METDQVKQEIHVKMKQEEPIPSSRSQSPTGDELGEAVEETVRHEDVIDLYEVEDPLHDLVFGTIPGGEGYEGMADEGDEVDGEEVLVPELVRDQTTSSPS